MIKDSLHSIQQSASRFFSGTLLSRISGMLRDMSMAYAFGMQPALAAFMLAFRLAHLCRRLFGEGALQSAFIPEFETLRHRNPSHAFSFFRHLTVSLSLFLTLLITCLCLGLGAVLTWGHLSEGNHEVVLLTLLMLPSLLFICLFGLNASLLQCQKSYFIPGVAPVAFNLIWIGAVWLLRNHETEQAMPWLACAVVVACFFQWLLTVPKTYLLVKEHLQESFWGNFQLFSTDLRQMIKPLFLGIIGVAANQINVAVDSLFARYADPEGPAMLWYAIRIQQLPLALFGVALAGALLPPLSRALKALDWTTYYHFLKYALTASFGLMLPLTAVIFIMGDSSVNLIYGHGDFGNHDVIATTKCLWAYGAGLLPAAVVLIMAPACYANSNYQSPAIASLLTMLLNLVLNALFILSFGWGPVSVALATSISSWVNLFFLGFILSKKESILSREMIIQWGKIFAITLIATSATFLLRIYLQELPLNESLSRDFNTQFSTLISQAFLFFAVLGAGFYFAGLKTKTLVSLPDA